jgi:signal transduction histidine kinase
MTPARLLAAVTVVAAVALALVLAGRTVTVPGWSPPVAALLPIWLYWRVLRLRKAYDREKGERSWLMERERERAALSAVEAERSRIAAELHDVVSHNVSVMVIQAGAARRVAARTRTKPAAAETGGAEDRGAAAGGGDGGAAAGGGDGGAAAGGAEDGGLVDALEAVEACGRDAMAELRQLLGLLNPSAAGDDELVPQPSMQRLGTLVDRISFAGLPVEVTIGGTPRPLPAGIDVTAYRVVQEALTNALRHAAPGARAEVMVRYTDRNLRLEILNTGPSVLTGDAPEPAVPRPPGHGLLGRRERVAVYGGDLDARRRLGGGYRVRARIPLEGA